MLWKQLGNHGYRVLPRVQKRAQLPSRSTRLLKHVPGFSNATGSSLRCYTYVTCPTSSREKKSPIPLCVLSMMWAWFLSYFMLILGVNHSNYQNLVILYLSWKTRTRTLCTHNTQASHKYDLQKTRESVHGQSSVSREMDSVAGERWQVARVGTSSERGFRREL